MNYQEMAQWVRHDTRDDKRDIEVANELDRLHNLGLTPLFAPSIVTTWGDCVIEILRVASEHPNEFRPEIIGYAIEKADRVLIYEISQIKTDIYDNEVEYGDWDHDEDLNQTVFKYLKYIESWAAPQ